VAAKRQKRKHIDPVLLFTFIGGALSMFGTVFLVSRWQFHWVVGYLVSINLITILFYGYDKLISSRKMLRVPERSLHAFSFAGGTLGALIAQKLFRHKTIKKSFRVTFWTLAVIQLIVILVVLWLVFGKH